VYHVLLFSEAFALRDSYQRFIYYLQIFLRLIFIRLISLLNLICSIKIPRALILRVFIF
jgi:hypothetical protein